MATSADTPALPWIVCSGAVASEGILKGQIVYEVVGAFPTQDAAVVFCEGRLADFPSQKLTIFTAVKVVGVVPEVKTLWSARL